MKETIRIEGMHCGGCVNGVKGALTRVGAENIEVEIGKATFDYDESKLDHEKIVEAIEDAGYEVVTS